MRTYLFAPSFLARTFLKIPRNLLAGEIRREKEKEQRGEKPYKFQFNGNCSHFSRAQYERMRARIWNNVRRTLR